MATEVGQHVGDYEVLALLGSGGMGRVYKVRNVISSREEAMKILLPDFASDSELATRFMTEIRTLAGLEHPNITQLRTAFQYEKQFVMIMEYVEGTTLEKMATQAKIPVEQVLDYSTQVLSALSYAHAHGVTHRDIKPANIMVTSHGLVKLMDFGIAKSTGDLQLTRPGTTMGSVYYMSPEQVRGGTVDARSDIYSFGVTLYELVTGRKPFGSETSYAVLYAHMNEPPTPPVEINPELPAELNDIVLRAMEKAPEKRFQTADEFRNALKALRKPHPEAVVQAAVPVAVAAATVPAAPAFAAVPPAAPTLGGQAHGLPAVAAVPAAAAPPPFTPVAPVTPMPVRNAGKSHRGLWIGLGALAAVLALVVAGLVLPRVYATYASLRSGASTEKPVSSKGASAGSATSQPAPASLENPGAAGASAVGVAPATPATTSTQPPVIASSAGHPEGNRPRPATAVNGQTPTGDSAPPAVSAPPVPAGPSPQEIRQVRDHLMNLDARADAARSSLQTLRTQQQAQGYDLRGDIVGSMTRMNNFLGEANRALEQKDLDAAKEYMERADREVSILEKFLGR